MKFLSENSDFMNICVCNNLNVMGLITLKLCTCCGSIAVDVCTNVIMIGRDFSCGNYKQILFLKTFYLDSLSETVIRSLFHKQFQLITQGSCVYMPSQWEMPLQCSGISHWLGANTKWSLIIEILEQKVCCFLVLNIITRSGYNFAHVTTAQLSCVDWWSDWLIKNIIQVKRIFTKLWLWAQI